MFEAIGYDEIAGRYRRVTIERRYERYKEYYKENVIIEPEKVKNAIFRYMQLCDLGRESEEFLYTVFENNEVMKKIRITNDLSYIKSPCVVVEPDKLRRQLPHA